MSAIPLYMKRSKISEVASHCYLGLTMTQRMSWGDHISNVLSKASQRIGIINYLKYKLPRSVIIHLYTTLVLPVFDYCDQIYDNCTLLQKKSIEDKHVLGARVCTGALKSTNINTLLQEEIGWERMEARRWRHKLFTFHKIVYGPAPSYLTSLLPGRNCENPGYSGRNPNACKLYRCNTNKMKNSFLPSSVTIWNSISRELQDTSQLVSFKSAVNKIFLPLKAPSYYGQGQRRLSVLHTQLRLKHNFLNRHLYRIGIKNSPACSCGYREETELHFILECPNFAEQRNRLLGRVDALLAPDQDVYYMSINKRLELLNLLLLGSSGLSVQLNQLLFAEVHTYIGATERFPVF